MREIHSYVVRVYRRDNVAVTGLVEDVGSGRCAAFQTLADLCELLLEPHSGLLVLASR